MLKTTKILKKDLIRSALCTNGMFFEDTKEYRTIKKEMKVFTIIEEHPDELGFVLQAKDYAEYVSTYTDIGGKAEDAELTEEQFNILKKHFKNYHD